MGSSLTEIAKQLKESNSNIQLIYAFNGNGKTRLSREFKSLVETENDAETEEGELENKKIIYYNAFTEDLFYWDNDLENDLDLKLKIQPNDFTEWVLKEQGQYLNVIEHFQDYAASSLTPDFSQDFSEVTFSFKRGDDTPSYNIKISKGEESNFIWCIFYSLLEQVIEVLNTLEPSDRGTTIFNQLEFAFIDDPITSLDDNHLIKLAVDLSQLIKSSESELRYIITTHNPLFYNVLYNEFSRDEKKYGYKARRDFEKYRLDKMEDGTFLLEKITSDSPFSYHLYLKREIESAIEAGNLKKYHFSFLRNILEKTSTFLGYEDWVELLPKTQEGSPSPYLKRILNLSSHSKHSGDEMADLSEDDKRVITHLIKTISDDYRFKKE